MRSSSAALWRVATQSDLSQIVRIAGRVHPSFPEEPRIFAERLRLYSAGARVLERGGEVSGYLLGHPWRADTAPALNSLLHALPPDADTFYLHDLALLPAARGAGAARIIVEQMAGLASAQGLSAMSLVAVNGTVPFWERLGFSIKETSAWAEKLASYGRGARLMERALADQERRGAGGSNRSALS